MLIVLFTSILGAVTTTEIPKTSNVSHINSNLRTTTITVCSDFSVYTNFTKNNINNDDGNIPLLYVITATYFRRERVPNLIRLGQTLSHLPRLVWIVAEDSKTCSDTVSKLLDGFKREVHRLVHLVSASPQAYRKARYRPREVSARNAALKWIEANHPSRSDGVVYFADDNNAYDLAIFEEIRTKTKTVSVFPVGLVGRTGVSAPVVLEDKVAGFTDPWFHGREFPIDMAGFAFNVKLLQEAGARLPQRIGGEEDGFIRALGISKEEMTPLVPQEVLVWRTQSVAARVPRLRRRGRVTVGGSNLPRLMDELGADGVVSLDETIGRGVPICLRETCS